MNSLMTKLLNLPGVIVEDSKEIEETLILSVKVSKKTAVCPRCGQSSHHLHENKRYLVRDLPITAKSAGGSFPRRALQLKGGWQRY